MRISDIAVIPSQCWRAAFNRINGRPIGMQRVGNLDLHSGRLVINDGMDGWDDSDCIELPSGGYTVWIDHGEPSRKTEFFSKLISRVVVTNCDILPGPFEQVGRVGVDSAKVLLADAHDLREYWELEGPLRVGKVRVADDGPSPAELVCKEFGLEAWPANWFGECRIKTEVSKELEDQITAYLQSFPEFERNTFFHFYVYTENTFDRFNFYDKRFGVLPIDSKGSAHMAITQTGFGDGVYPISICSGESSSFAVEVSFRDTYTEQFVNEHFSD